MDIFAHIGSWGGWITGYVVPFLFVLTLVVFFHGNFSTLERDVQDRQHIPAQLAESGVNAVLAAPQFAVNARDSSPGNFWQPGYFSKWLAEVGAELAKLHGQGIAHSVIDVLAVLVPFDDPGRRQQRKML